AGVDVDRAVVLDVGARADREAVVVAAQYGAEPDARAGADHDVADHGRGLGDEGVAGHVGACPRVFDQHVTTPTRKMGAFWPRVYRGPRRACGREPRRPEVTRHMFRFLFGVLTGLWIGFAGGLVAGLRLMFREAHDVG